MHLRVCEQLNRMTLNYEVIVLVIDSISHLNSAINLIISLHHCAYKISKFASNNFYSLLKDEPSYIILLREISHEILLC